MTQAINALGQRCPVPFMMFKKALKGLKAGGNLSIILDDKDSIKDITGLLGAAPLVRSYAINDTDGKTTISVIKA